MVAGLYMMNALYILGAGEICKAKGFGNLLLKVMNCIEPAY